MKGAALQRPTHAAMVRGSQAIGLTRAQEANLGGEADADQNASE